ncbi:MAG: ABC transporter ATP-binding protein [Parasporobacterium sp.]|nr:ABC transporter ATP-binding protein [Parasporobacterium sp.]
MEEKKNILEVKDLVVHYETDEGIVEAVNGVSFSLAKGESLGLVGETGAGKTTIALSIMGLLPKQAAHIIEGTATINGVDLNDEKNKGKKHKVLGDEVSMIFQDPMTSLNPVLRVGEQIAEVIRLHNDVSRAEATRKATEMLELVGISPERYKDFPHQFSGGMKQRVVIAIALACNPELLIADEPTTALDVTIQAQILHLIRELKEKFGTALLLITHDFGVVADSCDNCAVMYAGEIIEMGTTKQVFEHPTHPYTIGLFGSLPDLDKEVDRLKPIPGLMCDPMDLPQYCSFYDRCERHCDRCKEGEPPTVEIEPGHFVRCSRIGEDS